MADACTFQVDRWQAIRSTAQAATLHRKTDDEPKFER